MPQSRPVPPPWTIRAVQAELGLLALLVGTASALVSVLLVFLALLSFDGGSGTPALVLSATIALVMVVAATAVCTGLVFLIRGLGRGSHRAWAGTLAAAVVSAIALVSVAVALLAPGFGLSTPRTAALVASPPVLMALLLVTPPTLRSVRRTARRDTAGLMTPRPVVTAPAQASGR
jgi:hypothetical protein